MDINSFQWMKEIIVIVCFDTNKQLFFLTYNLLTEGCCAICSY
jgi:hypothetical protein